MRLICYRAMCGDAFHLRYEGESGMPRNILLDMGQTRTYSSVLKGVISSIISDSEKIDALFCLISMMTTLEERVNSLKIFNQTAI